MTHQTGYLHRTFEYFGPQHHCEGHSAENIELRITFSYRPGYPAQIYGDPSRCYPAEGPEREYIRAERETAPGKWVQLIDDEFLYEWCVAAFEAADDDDLVRALPEREEV